jgi:predicted site-specific integrase-resolvase
VGEYRLKFYKAGEFARLIGITSVTLRNWDERGWLKPHHRSPAGYRFYSDEQLKDYLNNGLYERDVSKEGGDAYVRSR